MTLTLIPYGFLFLYNHLISRGNFPPEISPLSNNTQSTTSPQAIEYQICTTVNGEVVDLWQSLPAEKNPPQQAVGDSCNVIIIIKL